MFSETFLLVSSAIGIVTTIVCFGILYMSRIGVEQKNLSLCFYILLLFHLGFFIEFVLNKGQPGSIGMALQYISGIILFFGAVFVFASEYTMELPKPLTVVLIVLALCNVVSCIFFGRVHSIVLFSICGLVAIFPLVVQCILFRKKYKSCPLSSAKKNATLLFTLLFVPQVFLMIHLWAYHLHATIFYISILLAVCEIFITVFAARDRFVTLRDLRYQGVVDSIDEPLLIINASSAVVAANENACSLFPECRPVLDDESPVPLPHILAPILTDFQNNVVHEDVHYVYVNWNVFEPYIKKIEHQEQVYGYILRLHDVTEYHNSYLKLSASNTRLQRDIVNTHSVIESMRSKAVSGAIQFLRDRDESSGDHMRRSSNYTSILARQMRADGLYKDIMTDDFIETLIQVAPLHDVGKFFVAEEILKKPDQLTPQEYESVKSHVAMGAQMIDRMVVNNKDDLYYQLAREVTLYHHEWWDGSGYLSGLRGETIPLSARIVSVSTVFDLVSTNRPFQAARSFDEAFNIILAASGTQFDPSIIESFKNAKEQLFSAYTQMVQLA